MKKILFVLFLFLCSCGKNDLSPIGHTYQTQIDNLKITLSFQENGRFNGEAFNSYFGTYQIAKDEINLNLQGSSIKMGLPIHLEQENKYFKSLKEIINFEITPQTLILKSQDFQYQFHLLNTD